MNTFEFEMPSRRETKKRPLRVMHQSRTRIPGIWERSAGGGATPEEDGRGERGQKGGSFPFEREPSFQLKGNGVLFKLPFRGEGAVGAPPVGIETFERGCIEILQNVSMKEGEENTGGNEGRGTFGQGGEFKRYNDSCSAAD